MLMPLYVINPKVIISSGSYARKLVVEYIKGLLAATTGNVHYHFTPFFLLPLYACFIGCHSCLHPCPFSSFFLKTLLGC